MTAWTSNIFGGSDFVPEHVARLIPYFVLCFVRPFVFVALFGAFKAVQQSAIFKTGLGLALAMPVLPEILVVDFPEPSAYTVLLLTAREALSGATFAITCNIPVKLFAAMGEIINNTEGMSANGPQNPVTKDDATPLDSVATLTIGMLAFNYYLHLDLFKAFYLDQGDLIDVSLAQLHETVQAADQNWLQSISIFVPLLSKSLLIIALLISIDVAGAFAHKHLDGGQSAGLETIFKLLIGGVWLWLVARYVTSPEFYPVLRQGFEDYVIPSLR